MNRFVLFFLSFIILSSAAFSQQARAPERLWQLRTGPRFSARFVESSQFGDKVKLQLKNGKIVTFKSDQFCSADQQWILDWNDPKVNNIPEIITKTGQGVSIEDAIADAESKALNSYASFRKEKTDVNEDDDTDINDSESCIFCGFIRKETVLDQWRGSDGFYYVKMRFQIYPYVLDPVTYQKMTAEENLRRNDTINKQVLYVYNKYFNEMGFPNRFYSFTVSNVRLDYNNTLSFDITTECNDDEFYKLVGNLRKILSKYAIKRGVFHMKTHPFEYKGYKEVLKFFEYDVSRNIVDLKNYKDRIFVCICIYINDDGDTSWVVFELPKKFMFIFEPYSHYMMGMQIDLVDKNGLKFHSFSPILPEDKPFSPRTASFIGIWDARFRTRMKDEGVARGSQFAILNPNQKYNYDYVYRRFRGIDPLANMPYSSVYSIQPFFVSRYNDKTNLFFTKLTRSFSVKLEPYQVRLLAPRLKDSIRVTPAPLNQTGREYLEELEYNLSNEIE